MKKTNEPDWVFRKALGRRLRSLRMRRGFNQIELANLCGVSDSFVCMVEHGYRGITVETLVVLCEVLGGDPGRLLGQAFRDRDRFAEVSR
jgi:transcriptional regulator with XRE-family HTH domain